MTATSTVILQVQNLVKHFPIMGGGVFAKSLGAVRAVDGVSFTVYQGETFGLVGESGCGKTTMGRCILQLERPTAGQVIFAGQELTGLTEARLRVIRRQMQVIFQDPYSSLNPRMSVGRCLPSLCRCTALCLGGRSGASVWQNSSPKLGCPPP